MKYLYLIRGFFRALFGFCPKCNTSSPELYSCSVCHGEQYPRSKALEFYLPRYRIRLFKEK